MKKKLYLEFFEHILYLFLNFCVCPPRPLLGFELHSILDTLFGYLLCFLSYVHNVPVPYISSGWTRLNTSWIKSLSSLLAIAPIIS